MNKEIVGNGWLKIYPDGFNVRRMTRDEAKIVIDWFSYVCVASVDLEVAFDALGTELQAFVGDLDRSVVASIVHSPVQDNLLYGSLYYVEEKYRNKGWFRRLEAETADEYLEGRGLCVDIQEYLIPAYKKRGFTEAFEVVYYGGQVPNAAKVNLSGNVKVMQFSDSLLGQLMCYDDQCFVSPGSVQRRKLIELWVQIKGVLTMVAVDDNGNVVGFVCRRPAVRAKNNHIVGPLYAENYSIARSLMSAVTEEISGHTIWMTVCSPNLVALKLAKELKLKEQLFLRRMYLNCQLSPPNDKVFALTSIDVCGF